MFESALSAGATASTTGTDATTVSGATGVTGTVVTATTGVVDRTVGVATGFFFFASVSVEVAGTEAGTGGSRTAGETDDCFFEDVGAIIYYFMITYIIICLYNFLH